MSDLVPDVTGISPKEAKPGTKLTIRGNNFGRSASELVAVYVCGKNCSSSAEWHSERKITCRVAADCEGILAERGAKLRVKNQYTSFIDAILRFVFLASLRSSIFSKI